MYIYKKPHIRQPVERQHAPGSGAMNTPISPQTSSVACLPPQSTPAPRDRDHFQNGFSRPGHSTAAPNTSTCPPHDTQTGAFPKKSPSTPTRSSLPFSFPPLFLQPNNTSVTSLVPSTAEGKPIPLDDNTAAHRTSALRELNSNFPSAVARHRYAKSTGAQSSTYSQPVIVRTYSGPSPSHAHSRSNSNSARRGGSARRPPYSTTSTSISFFSIGATSKPVGPSQNGSLLSMSRGNDQKKSSWPWQQGHEQDAADSLPPLEAYTFKSFMANVQAESNDMDKALDDIAEIYARSRYSLSNQYEVHVAPHGSGSSFVSSVPSLSRRRGQRNMQSEGGPTLQAIQLGDESGSARSHRKRRSGGRRRSAAYGTLETIMSSSRSSEEDKSKKKSAAEIAEGVRGRSASKSSGSASGSPATDTAAGKATFQVKPARLLARKKSSSFANAILQADSTKHQVAGQTTSPRSSAAALLSDPALPQTSASHLEIRTTPVDGYTLESQPQFQDSSGAVESLSANDPRTPGNVRLIPGLRSWVPWRTLSSTTATLSQATTLASPSHAEGSLRELLKTVDGKKGKSVERQE